MLDEKRGGGKKLIAKDGSGAKSRKKAPGMKKKDDHPRARSPANSPYDADESDSEEMPGGYQQVPIQVYILNENNYSRY